MRVYAPGIAQIFDRIFPDFYTEKENETIKKLFPTCEAISIDYAVMEKHRKSMYFRLLSVGRTWGPGERSADCCHKINPEMLR